MRGLGEAAGELLERSSVRVGAAAALVGLVASLATGVGNVGDWVRRHPFIALGLVSVAAVLFVILWPRLCRGVSRASTEARFALVETGANAAS